MSCFPARVLADLNLDKGDKLFLTRSPDGYRITRHDPEFERQMTVAREHHEAPPQRPCASWRSDVAMENFVFPSRDVVLAIHEEQLAQHGGGVGVRDEGLLESALARAIDRATYEDQADVAAIAADYALRHRQKSSLHRRQQAHRFCGDGIVPRAERLSARGQATRMR